MDKDTLKKGIDIAAEVFDYAKGVVNSIRGKKSKVVEIIKECNEDGIQTTYKLTTYKDSNGNRSYEKSVITDTIKAE